MKEYKGSWFGIKPLPEYLTIKESKINGLGLFATDDIKLNKSIGITHIYRWEGVIRTPLGGFINHSSEPNCILVREEKSSESTLMTIKPISNGEELTLKYEMYKAKESE